ncbi:MAG: argininosuccinate synthase [Atopobiaceae bacterium]|nr:argininosuccinate synthase [Atopobiaceae bacterium]
MASKGKVVLAYSGGLDTSCLIPYLKNDGYEVVSCIADVGQPGANIDELAERAKSQGASASYALDIADEFCEDFCSLAVLANGLYENKYPLLSALSRPVISKHLVDVAHKEGAVAIAHGCTGKGNDQVRFELECKALDPELDVLGPVRSWEFTTRNSEIEYCALNGIEIEVTKKSPYSIDENVWGRAIECGILEDPWNKPPEDAWTMTVDPEAAPDERSYVEIGFEAGRPVSLNGERMGMYELIKRLNKQAGENGFGRMDMIEDRVVGLKSRECYEQPAALTLITAHKALEGLCLPGDLLHEKLSLEHVWAKSVYGGLWFSPLKEACDAFFEYSNRTVTGDVRLWFYKGNCMVDGVRSPYSIYDYGLATYDEGDTFDRDAAKGFLDLYGLPNLVWAQVNRRS